MIRRSPTRASSWRSSRTIGKKLGFSGPLGGVELQRRIERAAFDAGGGELRAPATRAVDFVERRASSDVPDSSYIPGIIAADVGAVLDSAGVLIAERLRQGLRQFEHTPARLLDQ